MFCHASQDKPKKGFTHYAEKGLKKVYNGVDNTLRGIVAVAKLPYTAADRLAHSDNKVLSKIGTVLAFPLLTVGLPTKLISTGLTKAHIGKTDKLKDVLDSPLIYNKYGGDDRRRLTGA